MELTEREEAEVKDLADRISRFVNGNSHSAVKALGAAFCNDHRTLVQAKMQIVQGYFELLRDLHKEGCYDLRNEAACKVADEVLSKVDLRVPFV